MQIKPLYSQFLVGSCVLELQNAVVEKAGLGPLACLWQQPPSVPRFFVPLFIVDSAPRTACKRAPQGPGLNRPSLNVLQPPLMCWKSLPLALMKGRKQMTKRLYISDSLNLLSIHRGSALSPKIWAHSGPLKSGPLTWAGARNLQEQPPLKALSTLLKPPLQTLRASSFFSPIPGQKLSHLLFRRIGHPSF